MKKLKKVLFWFLGTIAVLLIALFASLLLFKDRIINQFIREANKNLNTPVKVGKFEVSMFEDFPRLSIVMRDVYVEDSHDGQYPLLTAKVISFQMNPFEAYRGEFNIKGLSVSDSETNLKLNRKGENNYTIVKKSTGGSGSIAFELRNVQLKNTVVHYTDITAEQSMSFSSGNMVASIRTENDQYFIEAGGQLTIEKMLIDDISILGGKSFAIESDLLYDDIAKSLTINPSVLRLKKSSFAVSGSYTWKTKNLIDIETKGENTDIQTLISFLPESIAKNLDKYESRGDVYFNSRLKGELSSSRTPSFTIDFGSRHATIFHPAYQSRIENASVEGSFAAGDFRNHHLSAIVLKNIEGKLNNENFTADFVMQDLIDPQVILNFKGKVDAPALLNFYPVESLHDVAGSMVIDLSFSGKLALLKNKSTAQQVSTHGTVDLQQINLTYGEQKIPLEDLNGNLQFNNNDLALSNVSGKLGRSDFLLNGFFKNVITFLLFENQPIGIEADLKSKFIDLDHLFSISFGDATDNQDQEYTFSISKNVSLNFNCDIDQLNYKRFHGRRLQGDLLVKNQMAVTRKFSFRGMGGDLELTGIVDAKNNKAIDVVSTAKLKGIHADSVFYVFENFNQDFIEDRHLKGQADADVTMEMTLDEHLKLFPQTLIADIGMTIRNGQLNNFEPLKKLNRYLDDEGLSKLRFSDLKNDIHIENKTVYLPQMEVKSNVTDIMISGTHTFDQQIDYHLITPLRKKRVRDAEAEQAIEEDAQGGARLFLKITGTTDDYKISYDTEAVRKKIANDFRKEVKELKDAFKNKGKQKQKEVELEKDDYFDW